MLGLPLGASVGAGLGISERVSVGEIVEFVLFSMFLTSVAFVAFVGAAVGADTDRSIGEVTVRCVDSGGRGWSRPGGDPP